MSDPYYLTKVNGWTNMINWITTKNISFKEFCMNNQMDYILFSGYVPYMTQMGSDEERLAFVNKQINKCQQQLEEYIKSKNTNQWCNCPQKIDSQQSHIVS